MVARLSLLSVLATFVAVTIGQQCYGLDGSSLDDTYAPCNPSAKHSGCCATRKTTGSPDICLDNGLCMATNNEMMGTIWQKGCTDATGKDVACPRMCPDATNFTGLNAVAAWNIQTCDFGRYCCRASNDKRSCCEDAEAPQITTTYVGRFQASATPVSNSGSTGLAATAASTETPSESNTAPSTDTCRRERRQTAVVGGTLGGIFGSITLGLAGIIFWMYKKESRQRKLKEHYEEQFLQTNAYRKALASSAGSVRGSVIMQELRTKSSGTD